MNSKSIKRPRLAVNQRIGLRNKTISLSNMSKIVDKKTAFNKRVACILNYFTTV